MSTETTTDVQKPAKTAKPKNTPIARLTLAQVDAALTDCDKTVKAHSETVKSKLAANAAIPGPILRELSRANTQRSRLALRRITLLVETGDAIAMDLLEKLMKVKPAKTAA